LKRQGKERGRDATANEWNDTSAAQAMLESGMSIAQVVGSLGLRHSMNSVDALRSASGRRHRDAERNPCVLGDARDYRFRDERRAHPHLNAEVA
jgi:hypothetical protein